MCPTHLPLLALFWSPPQHERSNTMYFSLCLIRVHTAAVCFLFLFFLIFTKTLPPAAAKTADGCLSCSVSP